MKLNNEKNSKIFDQKILKNNKSKKYCFLDLETTGFDKKRDSIIEVAFILVQEEKILKKFTQVFVPEKNPLSDFVSHLTGIKESELIASGQSLKDEKWQKEITELIGDSVIIGHNIDFDIEFLKNNGFELKNNKRIDTHELSRILLPKENSFALEILAKKYGFLHEKAHRALDDVLASYELFKLLETKIKDLPAKFIEDLDLFFKSDKIDWYAKNLFFKESKTNNKKEVKLKELEKSKNNLEVNDFESLGKINLKNFEVNDFEVNDFEKIFKDLETKKNLAIRLNSNKLNRAFYQKISEDRSSNKFLIITSSIKNFPEIKPFPTPEVILDETRLENFFQKRKKLNDQETTFYIKCKYRNFLGHRGLEHFDLFFQERDLWQEICIDDENNKNYQEILKEKSEEKRLLISPNAFFEFIDLDIFKERILIIDEGEQVFEKLFHFSKKSFDIKEILDSKDPKKANQAHFFVKRFCQEYIEKKINKKMTPFPEKILIEKKDGFEKFREEILELDGLNEKFKNLRDLFFEKIAKEGVVSSIIYYPDNGNLVFSFWEKSEWENLKEKLGKFKKVIGYRVDNKSVIKSSFRYFLGISELEFLNIDIFCETEKEIPLKLPRDIVSQNSPDYNLFCAEKIIQIFKEKEGNMAVNFSSLETLKKVYDSALNEIDKKEILFLGERVSGGGGKMLDILTENQKLKTPKKVLYFYQRSNYKSLENYNFKTLIFQKFPFPAPDPLVESLEKAIKSIGFSFWDLWLSPQIISDLARRSAVFPDIDEIIFLDPRHNTPWGKSFLKFAFPKKIDSIKGKK